MLSSKCGHFYCRPTVKIWSAYLSNECLCQVQRIWIIKAEQHTKLFKLYSYVLVKLFTISLLLEQTVFLLVFSFCLTPHKQYRPRTRRALAWTTPDTGLNKKTWRKCGTLKADACCQLARQVWSPWTAAGSQKHCSQPGGWSAAPFCQRGERPVRLLFLGAANVAARGIMLRNASNTEHGWKPPTGSVK